MPTTKRK